MTNAFTRAQAAAIKAAIRDNRPLEPYSVTVGDARGDTRTLVVLSRSDRGAASVARTAGDVRRVGPARIRDIRAAIDAALKAADALPVRRGGARGGRSGCDTRGVAVRPKAPERPALVVFRWLPAATHCPARVAAGGIRTRITARPRGGYVGAPIAGSVPRPDARARLFCEVA